MTGWPTTPARRWPPKFAPWPAPRRSDPNFRRLGGGRPARCRAGGDRRRRRPGRPFRHAGRSGQFDAFGSGRRHPHHRPAGLRPFAQNQRVRLGLATGYCRPAGGRPRDHVDGHRRLLKGNPDSPPAARRRRRPADGAGAADRADCPGRRAIPAHGAAEQDDGAHRRRADGPAHGRKPGPAVR